MKMYVRTFFYLSVLCVINFFSTESVYTATKIPVPTVGTQYTLGYLFSLINTNNPSSTSNFLIALSGQQAIPANKAWSIKPTGSGSASRVGMTTSWVTANKTLKVTLKTDPVLISYLQSIGQLLSNEASLYQKILLYFEYRMSSSGPLYRFYLNDPFPGLIRSVTTTTGRVTINPAQNIINKWAV